MDDMRRDVIEAFDKNQAELGDLHGVRERMLRGAYAGRTVPSDNALRVAAGIAGLVVKRDGSDVPKDEWERAVPVDPTSLGERARASAASSTAALRPIARAPRSRAAVGHCRSPWRGRNASGRRRDSRPRRGSASAARSVYGLC